MSTTSKGNYYRNRTRDWLQGMGYEVAVTETTRRTYVPAQKGKPERVIFHKSDIWGADLVARSAEEMIWVQVKANAGHIAQGVKELLKGRSWPSCECIKLWVVHWPARRRLKDGPDVTEVEKPCEPQQSLPFSSSSEGAQG